MRDEKKRKVSGIWIGKRNEKSDENKKLEEGER